LNRRELLRTTLAGAAGVSLDVEAQESKAAASKSRTKLPPGAAITNAEIYKLLGYATMTGEDPLRMWARLQATREWLVGPLSPDAWAGQVFIADHADIFAFRFLPLPSEWMKGVKADRRLAYAVTNFEQWFRNWRDWWRTVGPRAYDDSYARLIWQMPDGGPEVTYEWARTDANEVVCRITSSTAADLIIQAYAPWDSAPPRFSSLYTTSNGNRFLRGRSWVPGTRDGMRWVLASSEAAVETAGTGATRWNGYYPGVKKLYLCGRQGQSYAPLENATTAWLAPGRIDELLERNHTKYISARPDGRGCLADIPAAINDQLEWSEVYTPERRRRYITVSRAWARENNSAPDFLWDSFFSALLVCQEDQRKSFDLIRDITSWQNDQGMFVQYGQWPPRPDGTIFPVAWGHTQYPVGALAVAKIWLRRPDRTFLEEIYPRLLKNHRWWFADRGDGQPWRDGNHNGLLELGSNYPEEIPYEDRQQVAYYESYDDSPQWWQVARYNESTGTLEQDTVERNCLYAMDCWVLAWMARQLDRNEEAVKLEAEHGRMRATINRLLWDDARGCYFNRRWQREGENWFFPQQSPDIFMSMLGKVASTGQAESIRRIFHDPKKFAGEWIMPSISRDDPLYPKQHYWRGKVWAPMNWLVYQGLKIYEWDHEARLLAESSAKMFLKPWREKGNCYENFLATTGEGSSDPHYTWGALMALIAVEEFVDINPWHGLRFGNLEPVEAGAIERYPIAGALYDVELSKDGLRVKRDGKQLFAANGPVELRHVRFASGRVSFEVRTNRPVDIHAGSGPSRRFEVGVSRASATV
jgi:PAS domain-containing protein